MNLQDWVGRTRSVADVIRTAPCAALSATLDREPALLPAGTPLPPLWHWLYFLPTERRSELDPDGQARRGGFMPPVDLPRRMWAGSQFTFHKPLRIGDAATRSSTIESIAEKDGRSGRLVFVKVRHEIRRDGENEVALTEFHDIVYRGPATPGEKAPEPPAAPSGPAWEKPWKADDVLLFRYSALTFNAYRIHYDRPYTTGVEGYPGLIVHGPLLATLLLEALSDEMPAARVTGYTFKALRPVFDIHPFFVCGAPEPDGRAVRLWVRDHEGRLALEARAELA